MLKPLLEQMPALYADAVHQILDFYQGMEENLSYTKPYLKTLTEREAVIARLTACGKSRKEIGQELFLSENTVKNSLTRIFDKLDITGTPKQKQLALAELILGSHPQNRD